MRGRLWIPESIISSPPAPLKGVGAEGEEILLSGSFSRATPVLAGILDSQGSHRMPG